MKKRLGAGSEPEKDWVEGFRSGVGGVTPITSMFSWVLREKGGKLLGVGKELKKTVTS